MSKIPNYQNFIRSSIKQTDNQMKEQKQTTETEDSNEALVKNTELKLDYVIEYNANEIMANINKVLCNSNKNNKTIIQNNKQSVISKNGVNGEIDENVIQGNTKDCWIIAGVLALNSTEAGKQAIKNAIQVNSDGSVTVTFKGVNKSFTITAAELKQHDTDNDTTDAYSNGDNDMLVLELATEKLMEAINSGEVVIDKNKTTGFENYKGDGDINMGYAQQMIYYLTGALSETTVADDVTKGVDANKLKQIITDATSNNNNAIVFDLYEGVHTAKTVDGQTFTINLEEGHSFAIKEYNDKTVTFADTYNSGKLYTVTLEEFAKLGIGMISVTKTDATEKDNEKVLEKNKQTNNDKKADDKSLLTGGWFKRLVNWVKEHIVSNDGDNHGLNYSGDGTSTYGIGIRIGDLIKKIKQKINS